MNVPLPANGNHGASSLTPQAPYLSHSRINKYLQCPEQYRLHYVESLRPKITDASLVFGQIVHKALEQLFRAGEDPVARFGLLWDQLKDATLAYKERESWAGLAATGAALLGKFVRDALPRFGKIKAVEQPFALTVTTLDSPIVGIIDLVADLDGEPTVIDFKTAAATYPKHEVVLSDQLTAYQLAEPQARQSALCVLLKTKEPRIEWHIGSRGTAEMTDYLKKVGHIAGEIAAGHYYRRPGRWCGYCDFLPVCMGDERGVQETLVQISPNP